MVVGRGGFNRRIRDAAEHRSEFQASKIELPLLQHLTPGEKLDTAIHCLEGAALRWFCWENRRYPFQSWDDLKSLLLRRFRSHSTHEGSVYNRASVLHRLNTVQEYHQQFQVEEDKASEQTKLSRDKMKLLGSSTFGLGSCEHNSNIQREDKKPTEDASVIRLV
ncbi:hypothetical protein G4B88_007162 [Cannabis sativa]|uniref:Retrotransposon gag domain-containing protein n=1 Tax=Cannabis sativa TaxID=3483 RepID=A0A7J6EUN0_CANSA|nr:hypothetical protein G4B88_007162 [Cannabis sativa]